VVTMLIRMGCVAVVRRRELVSPDHLPNSHIQRQMLTWSYGIVQIEAGLLPLRASKIVVCCGVECGPAGRNHNRPVPFLPVNHGRQWRDWG